MNDKINKPILVFDLDDTLVNVKGVAFHQIKDILIKFKAEGYILALATNNHYGLQILENNQLEDYFSATVCGTFVGSASNSQTKWYHMMKIVKKLNENAQIEYNDDLHTILFDDKIQNLRNNDVDTLVNGDTGVTEEIITSAIRKWQEKNNI